MKSGNRHFKQNGMRIALAFIMACVMLLRSPLGLAKPSPKVNWAAWTHAMLSSPEGQRVQKQQSKKLTAQWLASKATKKMAAIGIVPTTGLFDVGKNWLLELGSGQCGDVAVILEDVFAVAGIGQPILVEAFVSEEDEAAFQSIDDPFGFNTGHGIVLLSLDGEVCAFDPWMASYTQSLLSGDRWFYGNFPPDNKWNGMSVSEWWDHLQEEGYTRFWVGLPGYDGVSSQQHTNQVSGAADIEAACTEFLENKANQHQQTSAESDLKSWNGTWSVTSHHEEGPDKGGSYPSEMEVVATEKGSHVEWNKIKWPCVISGNTLSFEGEHPSGGEMRWVFVREGGVLIPEQSRFEGKIRGEQASGRYEGHKK